MMSPSCGWSSGMRLGGVGGQLSGRSVGCLRSWRMSEIRTRSGLDEDDAGELSIRRRRRFVSRMPNHAMRLHEWGTHTRPLISRRNRDNFEGYFVVFSRLIVSFRCFLRASYGSAFSPKLVCRETVQRHSMEGWWWRSGFLPSAVHNGVSGFGGNDAVVLLREALIKFWRPDAARRETQIPFGNDNKKAKRSLAIVLNQSFLRAFRAGVAKRQA